MCTAPGSACSAAAPAAAPEHGPPRPAPTRPPPQTGEEKNRSGRSTAASACGGRTAVPLPPAEAGPSSSLPLAEAAPSSPSRLRERLGEGLPATRPCCAARPLAPSRPPPPAGLLDSHIVFDAVSALYGAELVEAMEHDDGSGFSVVSGPSSEAGADPGGEGEGAFWVGVFCFSVLPSSVVETASRAGRSSASKASWSGRRALPSRSWTICEAGDAGHERHRAERPEGRSLHGDALDMVRNSCSITRRRR